MTPLTPYNSLLHVYDGASPPNVQTHLLPPGAVVRLGSQQLRIPRGESRVAGPWIGDIEVIGWEPEPGSRRWRLLVWARWRIDRMLDRIFAASAADNARHRR
jgi:hypothetical protein